MEKKKKEKAKEMKHTDKKSEWKKPTFLGKNI